MGAHSPAAAVSASATARTIRRPQVRSTGKEPDMMLTDKVAVIYGAGGGIGGAVARTFAAEGARLFLTGRDPASVEVVAKDVVAAGGDAEVAQVDALDEQAVDEHLQSVIDRAGRVDISFDAVGFPNADTLGVPLTDLAAETFSRPIAAYLRAYFLTARSAARHMLPRGSGVIMTVTALHSRTGIPLVGGYGPAMAAKEALTRGLSAELAPRGLRVVGLRPQGMPETRTIRDAFEPRARASGMTWQQWQESLAGRTHPRRLMTLAELAAVAAFLAGDRASGMTGTTVNLTMGSLDD
jgi:NAD(P)-dependent dehydrogenase (short-subunit alcohol dehydrogenase family)